MATWFRRCSVLAAALALLLIAGGCFNLASQSSAKTGSLSVRANFGSDTQAQSLTLDHVTVTLTRNSQSRNVSLAVQAGSASGTITGLTVGTWHMEIKAYTTATTMAFLGSGDVEIVPDKTVSAAVTLRPVDPQINLTIDLSKIPDGTEVQQGHFYVDGHYSSFTRPSGSNSISITRTVSPGTHDYKVVLYSTSTAASNTIVEGAYQTITVGPGEVATIAWVPQTSSFSLSGTVDEQPPTPTGLAVTDNNGILAVSWQSVSAPDLLGYQVYMRSDPLDQFTVLASPTTAPYTYSPSGFSAGDTVQFAVASVDTSGLVSVRSAPVDFTFPSS